MKQAVVIIGFGLLCVCCDDGATLPEPDGGNSCTVEQLGRCINECATGGYTDYRLDDDCDCECEGDCFLSSGHYSCVYSSINGDCPWLVDVESDDCWLEFTEALPCGAFELLSEGEDPETGCVAREHITGSADGGGVSWAESYLTVECEDFFCIGYLTMEF